MLLMFTFGWFHDTFSLFPSTSPFFPYDHITFTTKQASALYLTGDTCLDFKLRSGPSSFHLQFPALSLMVVSKSPAAQPGTSHARQGGQGVQHLGQSPADSAENRPRWAPRGQGACAFPLWSSC